MSNTRITALTAVTTPALTDTYPVVQSGTTKQITATQMRTLMPGAELDYAQVTSDVSITATGGTGVGDTNLIVGGSAVTYDGSTAVMVEFNCARTLAESGGAALRIYLFDGSTLLAQMGVQDAGSALAFSIPFRVSRRLTPSAAAHTYSIRASTDGGTATASAGSGSGGALTNMPAFIRITKV